jgi:hypothetical protein
MPNKPREKPCEKIELKEYNKMYSREYYKYNKDAILAKAKLIKQNSIIEEVKAWKEDKLNDLNAFNPFREN